MHAFGEEQVGPSMSRGHPLWRARATPSAPTAFVGGAGAGGNAADSAASKRFRRWLGALGLLEETTHKTER
jgi:hypothetical protein